MENQKSSKKSLGAEENIDVSVLIEGKDGQKKRLVLSESELERLTELIGQGKKIHTLMRNSFVSSIQNPHKSEWKDSQILEFCKKGYANGKYSAEYVGCSTVEERLQRFKLLNDIR